MKVSVIVPCRNERNFIEPCLSSILRQRSDFGDIEVVIADGMSNDGTREIISSFLTRDSRILLVDNLRQNTPAGLNAAIRAASGDIIVRMDVHTQYTDDYISKCVETLKETKADNVGGPWQAAGNTYIQRAIALAFQSSYSSGGARSHNLAYEGEVDSVYLGCWRRQVFEKVGLFDEDLIRNQDDELNLRMTRSGLRIWQSPRIKSVYYPRGSILDLFRQYLQYGYWKVLVIRKHRITASIRHLIPAFFVFCLVACCLLALSFPSFRPVTYGICALYLVANVLASVSVCRKSFAWKYLPVMPVVFSAFHVGYGCGFLHGIIDFGIFGSKGRECYTILTRQSPTNKDE